MKESFKITQAINKGLQFLAALAALISTLSLWGIFPDFSEIPSSVAEALKSDVRPAPGYRSLPIAAASSEEGRLKSVLLIRDQANGSNPPAAEPIAASIRPRPQSPCPKDSEKADAQMSEWGNIDCLEAGQLSLHRFLPQGDETWSSQGLGSEHQKFDLEFLSGEPASGATGSEQLSQSGTRLLIAPRWKVERFRIVAVLNTLVSLATVALACLVAFEAYQYLRKREKAGSGHPGSGKEPSQPEAASVGSDEIEDDDYLLQNLTPNPG